MPWRAELEPQGAIVCVAYEGDVGAEEVRACVERVIELMLAGQTSLVLMELDAARRIEATTMEIVNLPELYRSLGLRHAFRQAIVVSSRSPVFDQAAFYETVCVNRGHAVKIFPARAPALEWLAAPAAPRA